MRYFILFLFFTFTVFVNYCRAQYKQIHVNDAQTAEMTGFTKFGDMIFMAGSIPDFEELTSIPTLAAINVSGDTLWTRVYNGFSYGGLFNEIMVDDDTLYVMGYLKDSKYSGHASLAKVTNSGEIISYIEFPIGCYENSFTIYDNKLFVSLELWEKNENILYRLNKDLTVDTLINFDIVGFPSVQDITPIRSSNLNSFMIHGENEQGNLLFQVQKFDTHLKRQDRINIEPNISGDFSRLINSMMNEYWLVTREKLNNEYYLSVMSFDSVGRNLFDYRLPTSKITTICALQETLLGDILVLIKSDDLINLMIFRNNKLLERIELEELQKVLPKNIIEVKSGIFKIFGLGFYKHGSIAAYGSTFMYDFKVEN